MTILALEFSSEQRSVAVARAGRVLGEASESGGRHTAAFGMVEKVLAEARLEREEIEVIVVGLGPGSYTGIRAAIALAQGWQLARGVKLLGTGSMAAIAAQAQAEKISGRVNVVVDAQRGESYLATWEISETLREVAPLRIAAAAEIEALKLAGETCAGPAAAKVLFPRAGMLAGLAAGRNGFVPGEKLEPIYLREAGFVKAPPGRAW